MILLKLLNISEFYNEGEFIEIAKGKNKMPETWSEGFEQIKRAMKWQRK